MKNRLLYCFVRFLLVTFIFTLAAALTVTFAACQCVHDYASEVTQEATCVNGGVITYTCRKCGDSYRVETSKTEHELVSKTEGGTKHSFQCEHCDYKTEPVAHVYDTLVQGAGEPSTCSKKGYEVYKCVCGATVKRDLQLAEHQLSYVKTDTQHYEKCSRCDYKTSEAAHDYSKTVSSTSSTCSTNGTVVTECVCGQRKTDELPTVGHDYSAYATTENADVHWKACKWCSVKRDGSDELHQEGQMVGYGEGDCQNHPYETYNCPLCNANVKYEQDGYGKHNAVRRPACEPTDYEDGNYEYYECIVAGCGKYFSGEGAGRELDWERDIFRPRKVVIVEDYSDVAAAAQTLGDGQTSARYYQLDAKFGDYDEDCVVFSDKADNVFLTGTNIGVDLTVLAEDDVVTLRFKVKRNNGEAELVDVTVIDIVTSDKLSVTLSCKLENKVQDYMVYFAVNVVGGKSYEYAYNGVTRFINVLNAGDKIYFTCSVQAYNIDVVLKSLTVNGNAYVLTDGRTAEITVTEDIAAEFVFAEYAEQFVEIKPIDTSLFNKDINVNDYVSYRYNGGTNANGRLHKNSLTAFTVNNANITRLRIVYERYESNDYDISNVAKNVIRAGTDKEHAREVVYSVVGYEAAVDLSNGTVNYFEYSATASIARILSITVYYEANNTFAA